MKACFVAAVFLLCLVLPAAYSPVRAQSAAAQAVQTKGPVQDVQIQGKVQCSLKRQVVMPFKGVITSLDVQPGQAVKKGDVLARYTISAEVVQQLRKQLSAPHIHEIEATLSNAGKNLVSLEAKQSELQNLATENMASAQSLEEVEKEIQFSRHEIAAGRERLKIERDLQKDFEVYLKGELGGSLKPVSNPSQPACLIAPITGNVVSIQSGLRDGLELGPGAPTFLIGVIDPMVMHAQVHETDMLKVATGDKAEVTLESVPNRTFEATVSRLSLTPLALGLEQPSYYDMELTVPNSDHLIKEGFKGQVVLHLKPGRQQN
jgi:multidrug resistance efflux pump